MNYKGDHVHLLPATLENSARPHEHAAHVWSAAYKLLMPFDIMSDCRSLRGKAHLGNIWGATQTSPLSPLG